MKIRSHKIIEARLAEELSQADVVKHLNNRQPWFSKVEHGHILIAASTEDRIVALIHRLGEMRRAVAIAEKKLAASVFVPMRAPSHRKARA
jgi:predicted transcriptional regulator